jgi:hypothetical protein
MIRHQYNLQTFYKEDALTYYLLGAFCTDGNVRIMAGNKGRAQIGSKDYDWLVDINQFISPNKPIEKGKTCFLATYNSIEIVEWLITHNCVPNKSLTLELPQIPDKYIPDFIRGCWDGDGTLGLYRTFSKVQGYDTTKRSCSLSSGSKNFAEGLRQLLSKLNIVSNIYTRQPRPRKIDNRMIISTNNQYIITISSKHNLLTFCKTIYYKGNKLSLKRKENISKQLIIDCTPKLHHEQVLAIQNDPRTLKEISQAYGIASSSVGRIKRKEMQYCQ